MRYNNFPLLVVSDNGMSNMFSVLTAESPTQKTSALLLLCISGVWLLHKEQLLQLVIVL
jgi:hypothetical protein